MTDKTSPLDNASPILIELAKAFIQLVRSIEPGYDRAFYRFQIEPGAYGSNASYIVGPKVELIDTIQNADSFDTMNELGISLVQSLNNERGVLLMTIDANFDYNIQFDWADINRWRITKLDGGNGLPAGI